MMMMMVVVSVDSGYKLIALNIPLFLSSITDNRSSPFLLVPPKSTTTTSISYIIECTTMLSCDALTLAFLAFDPKP